MHERLSVVGEVQMVRPAFAAPMVFANRRAMVSENPFALREKVPRREG